jgi:flagellar basal-body rod modification protein FlgD
MAVAPVASTSASNSTLGLSFQSLLQIILTQLTAQDPLQPLDNFQFVSQLAEFSQLQLTETLNENVSSLLASQSAAQAVGLLGHQVDVSSTTGASSSTPITGTVTAVTFTSTGTPQLTVQSSTGGQTVANISLSQITQVM